MCIRDRTFAGGIKEVDSQGNDISSPTSDLDSIIVLKAKDFDEQQDQYLTIIEEDECAPDAKQYFHKQFEEHFGMNINQYIAGRTFIDYGDTKVYDISPYRIINEIGRWIVQKLIKQ